MRFIITAQAGTGEKKPDAGFDEKLFSAYMAFNEEMHKAGVLVASEGLNPAAKGARIEVKTASGSSSMGLSPSPRSWSAVSTSSTSSRWTRPSRRALRAPSGMGFDDVLEVRQLTGAGIGSNTRLLLRDCG